MKRWLAGLLLVAGCVPSSEVLLAVDTDAPVPRLFDRLRIDIAGPDGTVRDRRDVEVSAEMFRAQAVSFGIATRVGETGWTVRLRLYRAAGSPTRDPPVASSLDALVQLPALDRTSIERRWVSLDTESIGVPRHPVAAVSEGPVASRVGSWDGAADRPCVGTARPEEACVPGGSFLFGDPQIVGLTPVLDEPSERLVVVDPYFLDVREVTVAEFRHQMSHFAPSPLLDPTPQAKPFDPGNENSWCLWTDAAGPNEDLPLNCVGRDTARRYCRSLGKDLPTEAQFEYLASGRGAERVYLWGHDEPRCADAIWGLAGAGGAVSALLSVSYDGTCLPPSASGGVAPPGQGALDRMAMPDPAGGPAREVVDLAGNVSEWALDVWSRSTEPYWSGAGVLRNPVANLASDDVQTQTARGGYWFGAPVTLRAGFRQPQRTNAYSAGGGFRCARPAQLP